MQHIVTLVLFAATLVALSLGSANAQSATGWYLGSIAPYFPPDRLDDLRVVQQNLASTATSNQAELGARLVGYQVLFGFDVALTESVSLGIKGRRAGFERFRDATGLDHVRSRVPITWPDGRAQSLTEFSTGDVVVYGFGMNLKYEF